jgi:hypothetical protein
MGKWVLLSAIVLAIGITPFAIAADGDPVRAGGRTTFTDITRILGNSSGYATQQSNLRSGDGGAARYGCRSSSDNEFCLLSKNIGGGGSFRFQSTNSLIGGSIEVEVPQGRSASDARPFTTNATGVATGLNADQVDGLSGDQLRPRIARVTADGALANGRGVTSVSRVSDGTYDVTFDSDVTNCAYTATAATVDNAGAVSTEEQSATVVRVRTRDGGGADGTGPTAVADKPFSLTVSC